MQVVYTKKLDDFKKKHADTSSQLDAWLAEASEAAWARPLDIKERYSSVSFLSDNRVVFNIKGNKYRLVVKISYKNQVVMVDKIGTHEEYSKWHLE